MNRLRYIATISIASLLMLALLSATSLRGVDTGRLGSVHVSNIEDQFAVLVTTAKAGGAVFTAQRNDNGLPPPWGGVRPVPPNDSRVIPATWTEWRGPVSQARVLSNAPRAPPRRA